MYKRPIDPVLHKLLPFLKLAGNGAKDLLEKSVPGFTLDDLVNKTIQSIRRLPNPLPYNPKTASPNPKELRVIYFSDGSVVLNMAVGCQDWSDLFSFLIEGNSVRYSLNLYY